MTYPHTVAGFLAAEFEAELQRVAKYSLRRFAKEAGVSSPYMSRVLRGQRRISHPIATKVARNLKWTGEKLERFLSVVSYENAPDATTKAEAFAALGRTVKDQAQYQNFDAEQFRIIARWHHSAILELATMPGFSGAPRWIAKRLKISPIEAVLALDRLKRVGALKEEDGKWQVCFKNISTGNVPSAAIRSYHKDILDLTKQAIDTQTLDQRDFSTVTMAVSPSRFFAARDMITKFRRELTEFLNSPSEDRAIYQLSIHLFQLDSNEENRSPDNLPVNPTMA